MVTVSSLLGGFKAQIVDFFQEFGPDSIFVSRLSGDPSGQNRTSQRAQTKKILAKYAPYLKANVRSIDDIRREPFCSYPRASQVLTAKVPGYESDNLSIVGVTPSIYDITPAHAAKAACLANLKTAARPESSFSVPASRMRSIRARWRRTHAIIDGTEYTVIGVFEPAKGGFFGKMGKIAQVAMPLSTALTLSAIG